MIADVAERQGTVAEELARKHGANSVESTVTDVSDESAVKALVAKTMDRFGKIDILVNNAALFAPLQGAENHRDRCRAVGSRDGGQYPRRVSDDQARRAAHDRAEIRENHQYQLRHRRPRHSAVCALRDVERRGDGVHAGDFARARRAQYLRQQSGAGLYAERHRDRGKSRPSRTFARSPRSRAVRSSATNIRKTCSARWCSWPPPTAILSPGRPSRSTAAQRIIEAPDQLLSGDSAGARPLNGRAAGRRGRLTARRRLSSARATG